MLYPTIDQLTKDQFNRYELALATAKCARALTNEYVEQKGLRNEDSIEMLGIIKASRSFDISVIYGWNSSLETSLVSAINSGNSDIASIVASGETSLETNLNKMLEGLKIVS